MTTYKLSIKGPGSINEDYIEMSVLNDSLVVTVSDGMGGMDCGDKAKAGEPFYQPYEIFTFKFDDGVVVRIDSLGPCHTL